MKMNIKKIAVLTSGGDSPGMNTALRAVVRTCAYNKIDCVGVSRGFQGLINNDIKTLKKEKAKFQHTPADNITNIFKGSDD